MGNNESFSKINFFDRFNASTLSLITPEMAKLKRTRKRNNYPDSPTFAQPVHMPFETVNISGVNIRYAHSPAEEKPTLVMLCPFPQSIMAYAPVWDDLASRYNLYAYDLPGFGRSEGTFEFMNFKAQGDFLNQFLIYFQITGAHFLGPDIGMPTILHYTGNYNNSAKSLMIGDGPAISPSSNGSAIRKMVNWSFWRMIFRIAGAGAIVEAGARFGYVNYRPNSIEMSDYKKSYTGRVGTILEWFKGYPNSLSMVDPLLDKIKLPALVFWGDNDALLYPDNGERIVERMQNSELHIFKDCGHFCYQDRHEEFKRMIIDWIDKHENS